MKSIIGTFMIFLVLYIMLTTGVFRFLAQESVTVFALSAIFIMLAVAFIVLGAPNFKKKGESDDK